MVEQKKRGVLAPAQVSKLSIQNVNVMQNSVHSSISRKRKNDENTNPMPALSRDIIYEDQAPASKRSKVSSTVDCGVQTDNLCCGDATKTSSGPSKQSAQDVLDMLTSAKPGERYWEMVASERKAALAVSLAENKQLHARNSELQLQVHSMSSRIEVLQSDNAMLEEMLGEARKLAELVQAATDEDQENLQDINQEVEDL
ncbi:geminin-like [Hyalella azteca]|uniref:Geminin-like n=1 Tax=Hyalella azteca TaxID=294128 RepID=A0A8B7N3U5_HYAAZ|nr:geminin-like [Hyalella azteca]